MPRFNLNWMKNSFTIATNSLKSWNSLEPDLRIGNVSKFCEVGYE